MGLAVESMLYGLVLLLTVVLAGETGELTMMLVLAAVTVSSNKAVPPLANTCATPLTFQSFKVEMSQLKSVKPVQTNASEVIFNWTVLPFVDRLPPAPTNAPNVTAGG